MSQQGVIPQSEVPAATATLCPSGLGLNVTLTFPPAPEAHIAYTAAISLGAADTHRDGAATA